MKSFKEIAEDYQEKIYEAKLVKKKTYVGDDKGNLKKVIKKYCGDADKKKLEGYKIVGGKKCEKMKPSEIHAKKKTMKKVLKTKQKHANKNAKRAEMIRNKKIAKGLISPKTPSEDS
jgi:hypothetical protein